MVFVDVGEVVFKCRWCSCVFSTEVDLASHLRAFGDRPHSEAWVVAHKRLEKDYF